MKDMDSVIHGDFLNNTLPDKCANLIIADPPYFEVKGDFDFVWNSFEDYLKDVEKWAIECKRILADNGTLFWYGHAKYIAYTQVILDKYFKLENSIVWRKTDCQTRKGIENFRSFAPVTERVLMYSQESYNLTNCIYNIRDYIRKEIKKAKGQIVFKEINKTLGTATNGGGVASACLSLDKTKPAMFTKEMYEKLQNWCYPHLRKEYEDLRKEYEDLRKEYEDLRRPFNNYLKLEDVWDLAQDVHITGTFDHPTKKTEKLARIMINTCSRKNDLVVVPFTGSGTEVAMSIKEGRKAIGYDIEKKYVDMSNKRIKTFKDNPSLFFK